MSKPFKKKKRKKISLTGQDEPKFVRLIDLYLTRPPETDDQKLLRLEKEKKFLKIQSSLILPWMDNPKDAESVEDYFEAGLPMGFMALISGKEMIEHNFIWDIIFGSSIKRKLLKFEIQVNKDNMIADSDQRNTYNDLFKNYNPEVFYSFFSRAMTMLEDGKNYNLFVLMKKDLSEEEILHISNKAQEYIEILSYSQEYYHYKNRIDPWGNLLSAITKIFTRANPEEC